MIKLNSIASDVLIPDNNTKMNLFVAALEEYNVPYQELGPGTNRAAFLIDGYVFKIGFDKAGIIDNEAEYSLSKELYPFVTKCYECNGLIAVAEYVTVISKAEFQNSKEQVNQILSHLADSYLLGDVGSVTKNFMNWGYRGDGSLVILDYAYIYRVVGDEMLCKGINKDDTQCLGTLEYDANFHKLHCPLCKKTYTFHELRRRIDSGYEKRERDAIKKISHKLTQPVQEFNDNEPDDTVDKRFEEKGDNDMGNKHKRKRNREAEQTQSNMDAYMEAMNFMTNLRNHTRDYDCTDVSEDSTVKEHLDVCITDIDDDNIKMDVDSEPVLVSQFNPPDTNVDEVVEHLKDMPEDISDDADFDESEEESADDGDTDEAIDDIDSMRAMLAETIDTDDYEDYDEIYGSGGFQKTPRRNRSFT